MMGKLRKSMKDIELLFAEICCITTNLPADKVLLQYTTLGRPSVPISENVAYITAEPETDERNIYKRRYREYNKESNTYTYKQQAQRTVKVQMIFYGPDSVELCTEFYEKLYFNATSLKLKINNMALVPDRTVGPTRVNEVRNGQWFKRCDLEFMVYDLMQFEEEIETFESIEVKTEFDM